MNSNSWGSIQPEFAQFWAKNLCTSTYSLVRLHGGINNQVFLCEDDSRKWLIKAYPHSGSEGQVRMNAEVEFLRFAAQAAPSFVPKLYHVDKERRCVVMEFIEGDMFKEGFAASSDSIGEATTFFCQLNADQEMAKHFIHQVAAEGFLSIREHLQNISNRIRLMCYDHIDMQYRDQAKSLIGFLYNGLEKIDKATIKKIEKGEIVDSIQTSKRIISPGDFGFHNARITRRGRIYFFDFEFAGWDDPAKTAIDFLLQPKVPIKMEVSTLIAAIINTKRNEITCRIDALMPILCLKWICIILAILQPSKLKTITSNLQEFERERLIPKRLYAASAYKEKLNNIMTLHI